MFEGRRTKAPNQGQKCSSEAGCSDYLVVGNYCQMDDDRLGAEDSSRVDEAAIVGGSGCQRQLSSGSCHQPANGCRCCGGGGRPAGSSGRSSKEICTRQNFGCLLRLRTPQATSTKRWVTIMAGFLMIFILVAFFMGMRSRECELSSRTSGTSGTSLGYYSSIRNGYYYYYCSPAGAMQREPIVKISLNRRQAGARRRDEEEEGQPGGRRSAATRKAVGSGGRRGRNPGGNPEGFPEVPEDRLDVPAAAPGRNCTIDTCVDLLPCSVDDEKLTVWMEPLTAVLDEDGTEITPNPSREFLQMRRAIQQSRFYVASADEACIVIPGIDTLNIRRYKSLEHFRVALEAGNRFRGRNVLIFTFVGTNIPAGKSIVARAQSHAAPAPAAAAAGASRWSSSFRRGFDISIPFWLPADLLGPETSTMDRTVFRHHKGRGNNGTSFKGFEPEKTIVGARKRCQLAVVLTYASEQVRLELKSSLKFKEVDDSEVSGVVRTKGGGEILWLDRCGQVGDTEGSEKPDVKKDEPETRRGYSRGICVVGGDLEMETGARPGRGKARGVPQSHREGSGRVMKSSRSAESAAQNLRSGTDGSWPTLDDALEMCEFTLIDDRIASHEITLMSALRASSIPVILSDSMILPFNEIIQWPRISISLYHSRVGALLQILHSITDQRKLKMHSKIQQIYAAYFSSLETITETTLEILESRILPNKIKRSPSLSSTPSLNKPASNGVTQSPPLFLPRTMPSGAGFTAVILAQHRVESLFALIRLLARVPSLTAIVVVWNRDGGGKNGLKELPPVSEWPHTTRPISVIEMRPPNRDRHESNRFVAFPEIGSECLLSLEDEDVHRLSADRVQFAYEVWRENPERLIGFMPNNLFHFNETVASYVYINNNGDANCSMKIDGSGGGMFYHKYYGILYGTRKQQRFEPLGHLGSEPSMKQQSMNFVISSMSGKSPLAVSERRTVVYS